MSIIHDTEELDTIFQEEPDWFYFNPQEIKIKKGDQFWSQGKWIKTALDDVNINSGKSSYRRCIPLTQQKKSIKESTREKELKKNVDIRVEHDKVME